MTVLRIHRSAALFLMAVLVMTACATESDSAPAAAPDTSATEHRHEAAVTDHHPAAAPGEGKTLLAIMQELGVQMTSLTHGIMTEDTALVARSAVAIAEHAPLAPEEIERIHGVLGEEMHEFERVDTEVHEASVALRDAAQAGRMNEVLDRLHQVQRGCVACHTRFRQRLLTSPTR